MVSKRRRRKRKSNTNRRSIPLRFLSMSPLPSPFPSSYLYIHIGAGAHTYPPLPRAPTAEKENQERKRKAGEWEGGGKREVSLSTYNNTVQSASDAKTKIKRPLSNNFSLSVLSACLQSVSPAQYSVRFVPLRFAYASPDCASPPPHMRLVYYTVHSRSKHRPELGPRLPPYHPDRHCLPPHRATPPPAFINRSRWRPRIMHAFSRRRVSPCEQQPSSSPNLKSRNKDLNASPAPICENPRGKRGEGEQPPLRRARFLSFLERSDGHPNPVPPRPAPAQKDF